MRVLIIDDNYPSERNLYGDVFAHVRVKEYAREFPELVVAASLSAEKPDYEYEGVRVKCVGSMNGLFRLVKEYKPEIVLIHFATFRIIRKIVFQFDLPYLVWVHGFEAIDWRRRLFNLKNPVFFLRYIKGNVIQLFHFRRLIARSNRTGKIHFIFVSRWMKKVAEKDCMIRVKNFSIIPNPINNEVFFYTEKKPEMRTRLLMIRPFESKKYGTDIVTRALQILYKKPFFNDLRFTIYGKGSTSSKLNQLFGKNENVSIKEGFLTQREIKKLHEQHGVFLCISRQDAQGVSMCEAMSSGLVPITSNNTAIPEFVTQNISGVLTDNRPEAVASAIEDLYQKPEKFSSLSYNASRLIIEKAGIGPVIQQEMDLIEKFAALGRFPKK